jgi:peptidoglycan/LPS O-acetylase OafA/YrhL
MLIAGPAIAFFGVAGGLLARDLLDDAYESNNRTASTIHTLIIHLMAFLALSAVYLNKMSGWIAVPIVAVLSGVLILESLDRSGSEPTRSVLYSLLGAGVMGEATLIVNWWPTHGWIGGAALLVCFFATCGILTAQVERQTVGERELIEYGLVSVVGLAILAVAL